MASPPDISKLNPYLQTPEFEAFRNALPNEPIGNYTIGSIFETDPIALAELINSEYLLQRAEEGDETAAALVTDVDKEISNKHKRTLQSYVIDQVPNVQGNDQVSIGLDTLPRETAIGEEQGFPINIQSNFGQTSDYNVVSQSLGSEKDRQEIASNGVYPDAVYQGDQSFLDKWMNTSGMFPQLAPDAEDPNVAAMREFAPSGQFLNIDKDSPWRIKAFFYPANLTPNEAKQLLSPESPNIETRYINPDKKELGIAVRDETTNGRFVPLRPQFGSEMLVEGLATGIGQETASLVFETIGLKGLGKVVGEAADAIGLWQKTKRAVGTVAVAGFSAGMGRFAQMAYGRAVGVNDIDVERAFEDAKLAAVLGGAGTAVVGTALATLGVVWRSITGTNIPAETLLRLRAKIDAVKSKGTSEEFTSDQLNARIKEVGVEIGETLEYRPTAGELTQDDYFKQLELELFSQLSSTTKGRQAYQDIVENNSNSLYKFWQSLTENSPEFSNLEYKKFQGYLQNQRKEYAEQAAEAAKLRIREIERKADVTEALPEQSAESTLTMGELGSTFTRDQESGGLIYKRNTPEFLAQSDEQYVAAQQVVDDAVTELSELKYDVGSTGLTGSSTSKLQTVFKETFGAGDSKDIIMRTLGEVDASDVIKSMVPMKNGVSTLKQLMGITKDADGNVIAAADLNFGQLNGMQNALNSLFMESSDRGVREVAAKLRDAVEEQMDDLITYQARKNLSQESVDEFGKKLVGNNSPTPKVLAEEIARIAKPLAEAQAELYKKGKSIERKFIRDLSSKEPSEIADFVLSSSPKQVGQLVDHIYTMPDSIVRIQTLKQLVIENIRKSMGNMPLAEQNKTWVKFIEKNEEQLSALFPEAQFLKMKNFEEVQTQASKEILEVTENLAELEKRLGKNVPNFIQEFLLQGSTARATGKGEISRDEFSDIVEQNPELRPFIGAFVKDFFQDTFEGTDTGPGTMLSGGLDVDKFINFITVQFRSGPQGTEKLSRIFKPLLGDEVGGKFARDLRLFGQILKRGVKRGSTSPMQQGAVGNTTLNDFLEEAAIAQKALIPPLTSTGRRITAFMSGYRDKAKSDLLVILADPSKLGKLLEAREKSYSRREFFKFLGALAMSREYVDIGSETKEDKYDRAVKRVQNEAQNASDGAIGIGNTLGRMLN